MPLYDYKCTKCNEVFEQYAPISESDKDIVCGCGALAVRWITAPSCHGLSDGPGSKIIGFNKSDIVEETRMQMKAMEDAGRLRDPKKMKAAQAVLDRVKNQPNTKIDYTKGGHPLNGIDRD